MNKKRKLFKTEKIEEKKIKEYEIKEILISKEEEQEEEKDEEEEENENKKETNNIINLEENVQKPKYYSPDEINKLFGEKKNLKVFKCFKIDLINIDIQKKLIDEKKVRKRRTNSEILKDKLENPIIIKKKYKLGRKEKEDNSDYFKMPDYNTGNNDSQMINSVSNNMFLSSPPPKEELPKTELAPLKSFEAEPTTYTLEQATNKMRELIKDLKEHGVEINADEMDFDTSYQIIIKIDKK